MIRKLALKGEIPMNSYILHNQDSCYVIDPGSEAEKIRSIINKEGWKVLGILLTHAHLDHIGALDIYPVPIYLHREEEQVLRNDQINGFGLFGVPRLFNLETLDLHILDPGVPLMLGEQQIDFIHTPGHTPGGVCYRVGNHLITGDTLFKDAVGRWDFPLGDEDQLKQSVINLIEGQNPSYHIHPGHGENSTIEREKRDNYFYHNWKKSG